MKKALSVLLVLVMVLGTFSGCGGTPVPTPPANSGSAGSGDAGAPLSFKIGGGPSGSTNYVVAAGFASLLNKTYPNYTATAEITIGTQENIRYVQSGEYLMCLAMMDSVVCAYEGTREYSPDDAGKFNLVLCGNATVLHLMVPENSSIQTFADLAGKNVGVSNGVMSQYYFPMLLEAYGMTADQMNITNLALQDMCDGMADGTFDAIFHVVGVGSGPISDLAVTTGIRFLPLSDDICAKVRETNPYWDVDVVPAGSYEQTEDTQTLSTTIALIASVDCPDQVVYDMLKMILENPDEITAIHSISGEYNKENALKSTLIPIHPGAERYYKEIGMM